MFSTYQSQDVTILLKDITGLVTPLGTREREARIQSGVHYSEMLPLEYEPSPAYLAAYHDALERYAGITAAELADTSGVPYLEEYDAWYTFTSDFGPGKFLCAGGRGRRHRPAVDGTPGGRRPGGVSLTAGRRVLAHPLPPNCKQSLNPLAIFHAKDYDSVSTQKVRVLTLFVYKTV